MINEVECPNCGEKVPAGNLMCQQCMSRIPDTDWPEPGAEIRTKERSSPKPRWWVVAILVFVFLLLLVPTVVAPFLISKTSGPAQTQARQSQAQQGMHQVQLALERYSVDYGCYPNYLTGGDAYFNIGTVNHYAPNNYQGAAYWQTRVTHPFDIHAQPGTTSGYASASWSDITGRQTAFGDPLLAQGYLAEYPANPFLKNSAQAYAFSESALSPRGFGTACYGGSSGELMWNISYFGELPLYKAMADASGDNRMDFPGQFSYHPQWLDGVSNSGHLAAQQPATPGSTYPALRDPTIGPTQDDSGQARHSIVYAYDLLTYGPSTSAGQDLDNSLMGHGTSHIFRTGYLTAGQERNPYIPDPVYGNYNGSCQPFDPRPYADGIDDFILMAIQGKVPGLSSQTPPVPEVVSSTAGEPSEDASDSGTVEPAL